MSRVSEALSVRAATMWRVALAGALATCLWGLTPQSAAHAEIRQDIVLDTRADFDRVLSEFDTTMRNEGLNVYLSYDETRSAPHNGVTLNYRHVEYSISDYNGSRSVTATFFVLLEPEDEDVLDALKAYVAYNYSYGGNAVFRIRGLGVLNWYEYGPMGASTELIDNQLAEWREQYLEGP